MGEGCGRGLVDKQGLLGKVRILATGASHVMQMSLHSCGCSKVKTDHENAKRGLNESIPKLEVSSTCLTIGATAHSPIRDRLRSGQDP